MSENVYLSLGYSTISTEKHEVFQNLNELNLISLFQNIKNELSSNDINSTLSIPESMMSLKKKKHGNVCLEHRRRQIDNRFRGNSDIIRTKRLSSEIYTVQLDGFIPDEEEEKMLERLILLESGDQTDSNKDQQEAEDDVSNLLSDNCRGISKLFTLFKTFMASRKQRNPDVTKIERKEVIADYLDTTSINLSLDEPETEVSSLNAPESESIDLEGNGITLGNRSCRLHQRRKSLFDKFTEDSRSRFSISRPRSMHSHEEKGSLMPMVTTDNRVVPIRRDSERQITLNRMSILREGRSQKRQSSVSRSNMLGSSDYNNNVSVRSDLEESEDETGVISSSLNVSIDESRRESINNTGDTELDNIDSIIEASSSIPPWRLEEIELLDTLAASGTTLIRRNTTISLGPISVSDDDHQEVNLKSEEDDEAGLIIASSSSYCLY